MKTPSRLEIASDFHLWGEYVDTAPQIEVDKQVEAYRGKPSRFIAARRDAAQIHAENPSLTPQQMEYWKSMAKAFDQLLKESGR